MSKIPDFVENLSKTLTLCEFKTGGSKGFWLYDETRGMNLSIRAKSSTAAFVDALDYYQTRLLEIEQSYRDLREKVDGFIAQVHESEEE